MTVRRHVVAAFTSTLLALLAGSGSLSAAWFQASGIGGPAVDLVYDGAYVEVYAIAQGANGGVYKSINFGQTFTLLQSFTTPYRLALGNGGFGRPRLFVATSQGLYWTSDLVGWSRVPGLPNASVNMITRIDGNTLYATVASGTARGLYKSTDDGITWTRVIVKSDTLAVTQALGCDSPQTVFAGGMLSPGGPSCTLLKSTDGGNTFTCASPIFGNTVNDVRVDCSNGLNRGQVFLTTPDGTAVQAVRRSPDFSSAFVNDGNGLTDIGATNLTDGYTVTVPGYVVGTSHAGIFTRAPNSPVGTAWAQFSTAGLDQRINRWIIVGSYVVATPSGVFYNM